VIFIPGNAGSFKQVRSIASSASRQYYTENGEVAEGMENMDSLDFFASESKSLSVELFIDM
jgi:glycosylphosphatidylinositol deacylase